jgi:hypothetical protein
MCKLFSQIGIELIVKHHGAWEKHVNEKKVTIPIILRKQLRDHSQPIKLKLLRSTVHFMYSDATTIYKKHVKTQDPWYRYKIHAVVIFSTKEKCRVDLAETVII